MDATENRLIGKQDTHSPSLEETYVDATLGRPHGLGSPTVKVLEVTWHPHEDRVQFCVTDIAEAAARIEPTKRNVISTIGKLYDPLGFLAPVIIRFKGLFQKLCENKLQWDETLTGTIRNKWESLVEDLRNSSHPKKLSRGDRGERTLLHLVWVLHNSVCSSCLPRDEDSS